MRARTVGFFPFGDPDFTPFVFNPDLAPAVGGVGEYTEYPIGLPIFDSLNPFPSPMKWIRRVREWNITVTATAYGSPATVLGTLLPHGQGDPEEVVTERFWTCRQPIIYGGGSISIFPPQMVIAEGTITFGYLVDRFVSKPTCAQTEDGSLFSPRMIISGGFNDGETAHSFSSLTEPNGSEYELIGHIDGIPVSFRCFSETGSISEITIAPALYWTFAKADNTEPILDASTGLILPERSPFGAQP